jgi:hypothetical protein
MAQGRKQTLEQIAGFPRQIEAGATNGKTAAIACKDAGIREPVEAPLPPPRMAAPAEFVTSF